MAYAPGRVPRSARYFQGFSIDFRLNWKSETLRVTSVRPWTCAVAPMRASNA